MGSRDKEGEPVRASRVVPGEREKLLGGVFRLYGFQ